MKISIITATYNSAKTLELCMDSVLNQTHKDIEYVIIDGNSNDGTVELIKSKAEAHDTIVWFSEKDHGIYDALNKGIERATGEIIGFVHSDDFLADETIVDRIASAFKSENVDGVYGNLHYVKFDDIDSITRNWRSQPFKRKLLNRGWMPAHPTLFLKSHVYKSHGHFNLDYRIAADYDFILRIFKSSDYKFYYLPETITKMRVGGASNRSLKNLILKTKEDYLAAKTNKIGLPIVTVGLKNLSKIPQWLSKS
ncbi:MAG: glycosyltransferase family 2 protein [Gelidibacter sp.]